MFQANLPTLFWVESILTTAHLINRTPTQLLHGQTAYALLHGSAPTYDSLRIFGSLCYAHYRDRTEDKFANRSRKCIFVGYPHGKNAWRLFDVENNEFFSSRDVIFFEDKFLGYSDHQSERPQVFSPDITVDEWMFPLTSYLPTTLTAPSPSSTSTSPVETTTADNSALAETTPHLHLILLQLRLQLYMCCLM